MGHDDLFDELLAKAFPRPAAPTPFQTEAFVARVMARLPEARPFWLAPRWLIPAFGLSFAALLVSLRPYRDASDPASALLTRADRAASPATDLLDLGAEGR
jgi:hypothetical protein